MHAILSIAACVCVCSVEIANETFTFETVTSVKLPSVLARVEYVIVQIALLSCDTRII